MREWYLIRELAPRSGAENMAIDCHLLELVEEGRIDRPVLRLYSWQPATLSLGYHQRWRRALDLEALNARGIGLVRRWTGGRAVLHDREMTYAVAAPLRPPFSSRISQNYRRIGEALQLFTEIEGAQSGLASTAPTPPPGGRLGGAPCFASLATDEIERGGRKMIGSAQKVGRSAFLQHGSIPIYAQSEVLETVTGTRLPMDRYMTGLADHYRAAGMALPSMSHLGDRLVAAFASRFDVDFDDLEATGILDRARIDELVSTVFGTEAFTFRK